jgi:hypothetical protein
MRNYNINIAGYTISFEADDDAPDLVPSQRFLRNICKDSASDILIKVHSESFKIPKDAERVFNAPLVEEIDGKLIKKSDNFWSIWKYRSDLFIKTIFPQSGSKKKGILKFSLTARIWDLYISGAGKKTDPFEYPIDGLILYYLTVLHGDIMIHASGVNHSGYGYIFSGVSGKGKTTIAKLWDHEGGKVIHDDRLIIRKIAGTYKMFNTPVYADDNPAESPLTRIYLIEHGSENRLVPYKGATAVSMVMANCIQHNWSPDIIARLMGTVSIMCSTIPVVNLFFKPDRSIIDFILDYE